MRFLFPFFLVLSLISAASGQTNRVSLPIDEKFSSDARIEQTKEAIPRTYMVGKKNGVEYRYFLEGVRGNMEGARGIGTDSGLGQYDPKRWGFLCQIRGNSGQKQCGFFKEGISIITYTLERTSVTWIGTTNFITDDRQLGMFADAVDVDGVEVYNSRSKRFSTEAISLMRAGKVLTLRRGPNPEGVTTYDLYGFTEALELCEWALKRIQ